MVIRILLGAAGAVAVVVVAVAAAAVAVSEMAVGQRGVAGGLGHLHFYRVQGAVDMDVLDLGWAISGRTFMSLRDFIWGRQASMRAGQLLEEFSNGNAAAWVPRAVVAVGEG